MKRRYRFSLQWKLVFFTTAVAIITYSTSAFFIYILYDYVKDYINMSNQWFTIITLLLGIIWTGILTYVFGIIIVRPLQRLDAAATEASQGNLSQEIVMPKTDDGIRSLSIAVYTMFNNINNMAYGIERSFNGMNKTVEEMRKG